MGFRHDMRAKTPQQQAIVAQRDREDALLKKQSYTQNTKHNDPNKLSLFMRLGIDEKTNYNGIQTMDTYTKFTNINGSVWFSTNSLATGMAKDKINYIKNAIKKDEIIYIYFVIGKKGGGTNDIMYKAEVIDIVSDTDGIVSPDKLLTPNEWKDCINKIWIKIKNLNKFTSVTTKDFRVISSNEILANSIENSEYHFGYIKNK